MYLISNNKMLNYSFRISCKILQPQSSGPLRKIVCYLIRNEIGSSHSKLHHLASNGPLATFEQRIASGELRPDPHQTAVAEVLQSLYEQVHSRQPPQLPSKSSFSWFFKGPSSSANANAQSGPKGLYIHGSVGGGKTTLMDLFYDCCTVENRTRVHFNSFMAKVHSQIHSVKNKESFRRAEGDTKPIPFDPTKPVADMIANETWLICFDEFQVSFSFQWQEWQLNSTLFCVYQGYRHC